MKINKEITKKKNDMMKSIMSNPKLARTFRDAVSAPIGSTKREQAKSVLSIMKKVGGLTNDGQGGPAGNSFLSGYNSGAVTPAPTGLKLPDFANMFIFPAAPAFKMPTPTSVSTPKPTATQPTSSRFDVPASVKAAATPAPVSTPQPYSAADHTNTYDGSGRIIQVNGQPIKTNLIEKGVNWAIDKAFPTAAKVVDNAFYTGAGALETLGKTLLKGPETIGRNIWDAGRFILEPRAEGEAFKRSESAIPWHELGSTWGSNKIAEQFKTSPETTPGTATAAAVTKATSANTTQPGAAVSGYGTDSGISNTGVDTTKPTSLWSTGATPAVTTGATPATTGTTPAPLRFNIAATSTSKILGTTPDAKLNTISIPALAEAIAKNEGYFNGTSQVAIKNNNPGNLKFVGQAGATADDRGFAVFKTAEEGGQALINDLTAKYNSGKYQTINDLMSVYSPDSDNPAAAGYTSDGTSPTGAYSSVSDALAKNVGASTYALGAAEAAYPGGLAAHQLADQKKLELEYNIKAKEQALSDLTAKSDAFLPTLKEYMSGKDQYLKYVDKMIEEHEKSMSSRDMSNPAVAKAYTDQSNYLYALKGKQEQRYSNYLAAATNDYKADVTKLTNDYTKTFEDYKNAVTEGATLDQNTYNDILTRASALYTDLEQAPTRALNQATVYDQYLKTSLGMAASGINQDVVSNPDYAKDKDQYIKDYGDKEGGLNDAALSNGGLENVVNEVMNIQGREPQALMAALSQLIQQTVVNAQGDKATETPQQAVARIKKYIDDFALVAPDAANALKQSLYKAGGSTTTSYIEKNMTQFKEAAKDLVMGQSQRGFTNLWLKGDTETGLTDKAAWKARHADVDSGLLDALYTHAQKTITPESTYAKNPMTYVDALFRGADSKEQAATASGVLL